MKHPGIAREGASEPFWSNTVAEAIPPGLVIQGRTIAAEAAERQGWHPCSPGKYLVRLGPDATMSSQRLVSPAP